MLNLSAPRNLKVSADVQENNARRGEQSCSHVRKLSVLQFHICIRALKYSKLNCRGCVWPSGLAVLTSPLITSSVEEFWLGCGLVHADHKRCRRPEGRLQFALCALWRAVADFHWEFRLQLLTLLSSSVLCDCPRSCEMLLICPVVYLSKFKRVQSRCRAWEGEVIIPRSWILTLEEHLKPGPQWSLRMQTSCSSLQTSPLLSHEAIEYLRRAFVEGANSHAHGRSTSNWLPWGQSAPSIVRYLLTHS